MPLRIGDYETGDLVDVFDELSQLELQVTVASGESLSTTCPNISVASDISGQITVTTSK